VSQMDQMAVTHFDLRFIEFEVTGQVLSSLFRQVSVVELAGVSVCSER
jgi:hypothetical protein